MDQIDYSLDDVIAAEQHIRGLNLPPTTAASLRSRYLYSRVDVDAPDPKKQPAYSSPLGRRLAREAAERRARRNSWGLSDDPPATLPATPPTGASPALMRAMQAAAQAEADLAAAKAETTSPGCVVRWVSL